MTATQKRSPLKNERRKNVEKGREENITVKGRKDYKRTSASIFLIKKKAFLCQLYFTAVFVTKYAGGLLTKTLF